MVFPALSSFLTNNKRLYTSPGKLRILYCTKCNRQKALDSTAANMIANRSRSNPREAEIISCYIQASDHAYISHYETGHS